ncbi:MAG: XdhC family protein, partial [Fimbriimonadaceae bacterium]
GFETVLIDPRAVLAASDRFPVPPDHTIIRWPAEAFASLELTDQTYAVVLTHDPKIDDVALEFLLRSPVTYIGALGSRVTQEKRKLALLAGGFNEREIARIHGPVGLKIGGRSPEEIALSIMAEIVQVRNARR